MLRFLGCGCGRGNVKVGKLHNVLTMPSRFNCSKNFPKIPRTIKVSNFSQRRKVWWETFFFDAKSPPIAPVIANAALY